MSSRGRGEERMGTAVPTKRGEGRKEGRNARREGEKQ